MPESIQTISLWQPWASLWAGGQKKIETRSWPLFGQLPRTLAVHAAKRFDRECRALCDREPFRSALARIGYDADSLPLGCVVGVVIVTRVYRFQLGGVLPPEPERSFGDYHEGRYGWETNGNRLLAEPVPAKGMQGVFGWTPPAELVFRAASGTSPVAPAAQGTLFGG